MRQIATGLLCALLLASVARADWIEDSNQHTLYLLRAQAAFSPENLSGLGLAGFDGEIMDLKPRRYNRELASDRKLLKEMRRREATEQHPRVKQDLAILVQALEDGIASAEVRRAHMLPYYNLHEMLFSSFRTVLDPRNEPERYPAALERLRKYTGRAEGYEPLAGLARARSEERFGNKGLLGPYRGQLEKDLENSARYIEGMRGLFTAVGLEGWEDDFAVLEQQLDAYRSWLMEAMVARARPDNRLPPAVYADNLRGYGVDASPEILMARAQYSYQLIRSEMKALAFRIAEQRGWEQRDLVSVIRALKQEQIPQDQVLERYRERLTQVEDIIRRENLLTLPERDAAIRLATEAESAAVPASFMSPPQLIDNTGQYGEFVLVTSNPSMGPEARMDDFSHDAITWALVIHEARPGHELQFASLVENGTSLARVIYAFNSANVEGWGLYAESIMQEYLPLEGQLFNLFTRLMRAARMFLDPMINTGQMTPAQAVEFMTGQVALSPAMANSEADRYSFRAPGQATAYYWGYMSLMRLRTELEIALGPDFDQREFHDFVLAQGLLPPEMLRQAVREHFLPQQG